MLSTPTEGKRRVWCQLVSLSRDTSLKGGRDSGGEGDRRWGARDAFEEVSDHLACVCVFQVVMMAIDVCAAEEEGAEMGGWTSPWAAPARQASPPARAHRPPRIWTHYI